MDSEFIFLNLEYQLLRMKYLGAFIFLLATYLPSFAQQSNDTIAQYYKSNGAECAIFPGMVTINEFDKDSTKVFTPTKANIDLAETKLKKSRVALDSMNNRFKTVAGHLGKYRRQYFGYIDSNGHQMLFINCFRKDFDEDNPNRFDYWLNRMVRVFDGAENFWHTAFDLNTGKFTYVYVNGRA